MRKNSIKIDISNDSVNAIINLFLPIKNFLLINIEFFLKLTQTQTYLIILKIFI